MRNCVLHMEDDEFHIRSVRTVVIECRLRAFPVQTFEEARETGIKLLQQGDLCAVIADLDMGSRESIDTTPGWELLGQLRDLAKDQRSVIQWIVYSGNLKEDSSVLHALKANTELILVDKSTEGRNKLGEILARFSPGTTDADSYVLGDESVSEVFHSVVPIYAKSALPLLIVGETGTGKEYLARHVHEKSGRTGPFVSINCGALDENLARSELFGHIRGSFTGASAHRCGAFFLASGYRCQGDSRREFNEWLGANSYGEAPGAYFGLEDPERNAGTLFLDEIGSIPKSVMGVLLRALSSNELSPVGWVQAPFRRYCRIIAATNQIEELKGGGTRPGEFRPDLYFRLAGAVLKLPAIHERNDDVIGDFVRNPGVWESLGLTPRHVEEDAIRRIRGLYFDEGGSSDYRDGNFRPLRFLLHRAALIASARLERIDATIGLNDVVKALAHGKVDVEIRGEDGHIEEISSDDVLRRKIRAAFAKKASEAVSGFGPRYTWDEALSFIKEHPKQVVAAMIEACAVRVEGSDGSWDFLSVTDVDKALHPGKRDGTHNVMKHLRDTGRVRSIAESLGYGPFDEKDGTADILRKARVQKVRKEADDAG